MRMRPAIIMNLAGLALAASAAHADPITLYSTGQNPSGGLFAQGVNEQTIYQSNQGSPGPHSYVSSNAEASSHGWVTSTTAEWITSAYSDNDQGAPDTTFTQTFTIGSGYDLSTATISGELAGDDYVTAYLNGNQIGTGNDVSETAFTVTGMYFQTGTNTLSFYVPNGGGGDGPGGLLVDNLSGSVLASVPEPSSVLMTSGGLFAAVLAAWRRRVARARARVLALA